jgi:acetyl esterase/lipase
MKMLRTSAGLFILCLCGVAAEPKVELIWPTGAPGAAGNEDGDRPTLAIYLPASPNASRAAVVVCPGGGYGMLAVNHEGSQIAAWLNARGLAAFVLKYRLGPRYRHPAPLQDAQRAIRTVRSRAAEFGVNPGRIGIWGFSAGGHLAATAATHFDGGDPQASDPIARSGSRPDFAILAYPVISFTTDYTHRGSRNNLLGPSADPVLVESLSNEKQVTPQTPPTFLFHTDADKGVPPENSVLFYLALRRAGVPAEMHIYERGPHGVGLAPTDPILSTWADRLEGWLRTRGLLE